VHGDGLQILNHGDDVPLTSTYQGSEGERDHEGARGGRQLPPRSGSRGVARGRGADGITSATVRERCRPSLQAPPHLRFAWVLPTLVPCRRGGGGGSPGRRSGGG
jgi:hypothetical protein